MPMMGAVFMHKSYLKAFRNNQKEDGRCLDINLLAVYCSPLEIHTYILLQGLAKKIEAVNTSRLLFESTRYGLQANHSLCLIP